MDGGDTIVVRIELPAPATEVTRLLRAISRAFPKATIANGDGCWVITIDPKP